MDTTRQENAVFPVHPILYRSARKFNSTFYPADKSVFPLDKSIEKREFIKPAIELCKSMAQNVKVLHYDWQSASLAEPRDNKNFRPPHGNLHKSSYHRLGPDAPKTGISETHERLEEIRKKDDYAAIYPRRSTLNMFSHNLTDEPERRREIESSGFQLYPDNYGCTDYRTTSRIEYPLHFPMKPWPARDDSKPWLYYRRTFSYTDNELSRRDCRSKFYDEEMNLHNDIAVMKMNRYKSYDPILKKFTNPCLEFATYKYKN